MTAPDPDLRPPNHAILWRYVPLSDTIIVPDENLGPGKYKVSSGAFKDPELSVAVADEAQTVAYFTDKIPGCGVVSFSAGFARIEHHQTVKHDAWPKEPAHALVLGQKSSTVARAFAKKIRWVHRPPGYDEQNLPDPA